MIQILSICLMKLLCSQEAIFNKVFRYTQTVLAIVRNMPALGGLWGQGLHK